MANNRMAIVCKDCNVGISIAKYYPLGSTIGGPDADDNAGWYFVGNEDRINNFYIRHKHDYDKSLWGGEQYFLGFEMDDNDWKYENN